MHTVRIRALNPDNVLDISNTSWPKTSPFNVSLCFGYSMMLAPAGGMSDTSPHRC